MAQYFIPANNVGIKQHFPFIRGGTYSIGSIKSAVYASSEHNNLGWYAGHTAYGITVSAVSWEDGTPMGSVKLTLPYVSATQSSFFPYPLPFTKEYTSPTYPQMGVQAVTGPTCGFVEWRQDTYDGPSVDSNLTYSFDYDDSLVTGNRTLCAVFSAGATVVLASSGFGFGGTVTSITGIPGFSFTTPWGNNGATQYGKHYAMNNTQASVTTIGTGGADCISAYLNVVNTSNAIFEEFDVNPDGTYLLPGITASWTDTIIFVLGNHL